MASYTTSGTVPKARRGFGQILRSYFYWDFPRGTVQYDVMVTLILLFIFVTPQFWDFGARPTPMSSVTHPIQVTGYGTHGLVLTVQADDVNLSPGASDHEVKEALKEAIQPVAGDAVFVERWQTVTDAQGNLSWQVWAHR
jgi:hypothetical protein